MNELIQYLKGYQAWRRGEDERTMSDAGINPIELGQRIDEAIELIEQLENRNRSLTDKVVELKKTMTSTEQERDQLKELLNNIEKVIDGDPNNIHAFSEKKLAEHDAEVIDETIKYMQKHYPSLCVVDGVFTGGWLKALRKRANQLRQKAQETTK